MRNYLYISDAKVDMYLPQIKSVEKQKIAAKLGFNVGLLTGSIETERMSLENRIYRLAAVEKEIRRNEIGSIENVSSWVEGVDSFVAATFPLHPDLMFFFCNKTDHFFGLTGSSHHIIGNIRPLDASCSISHLPSLLSTLGLVVTENSYVIQKEDTDLTFHLHMGVHDKEYAWTKIMNSIANDFDDAPKQRMSFLARTLTTKVWKDGKRYTLATPLYLTLEDVL
jgi:hypothetical protein